MSYDFCIVDTFNRKMFNGTSVAVFFVNELDDVSLFQSMAMEINTVETIFVKELAHGDFDVLCFCANARGMFFGNCLFAAAHAVFEKRGNSDSFSFVQGNEIYRVLREASGEVVIKFDVEDIQKATMPKMLNSSLNGEIVVSIAKSADNLIVEIRSPKKIFNLNQNIDMRNVADYKKVILTADTHFETDLNYDYCSRVFATSFGVFNDVVSPKAHVVLAKYWFDRIGKADLVGYQSSGEKDGYVKLQYVDNEFVAVSGFCVISATGTML